MNYKFISILTTIIAVLAIVYASIKAQEAEKQREWSEKISMEANQNLQEAQKQRDIALASTAESLKAQAYAEEVMAKLKECQSK